MTMWTISQPAKSAADEIRVGAIRIGTTLASQCATFHTVDAARGQLRAIREACDRLDRELGGALADAA